MEQIQPFLNLRRFAAGIDSVHPKQFKRPVVKSARIEGPAPYVGKTLPFSKVKLASLQLTSVATELFFCRFALVHIQARSIPLDDDAIRIAKGHFPMEHPAVFSIRPAHTSFVLEDFSCCEAGSPFGYNPVNVLRMNESRPVPAGHFVESDAEVFQPASIEVIEIAIRPGSVN